MKNEQCVVTVEDKATGKEHTRTYTKVIAESAADILALLNEGADAVIAAWNYGSDLKAKSKVRQAILDEMGGEGKALEAMAKALVKAAAAKGKTLTFEAALEKAKVIHAMED